MNILGLLPSLRPRPRCQECFFILLPQELEAGDTLCLECAWDSVLRSYAGDRS